MFVVLLVSLRAFGITRSEVDVIEAFAAWSLVRALGSESRLAGWLVAACYAAGAMLMARGILGLAAWRRQRDAFRAAHFEWLLAVGEALGLGFDDLGKRRHGRPHVLQFCDELQRLYGSENHQIAEGASFAVENWAAAGFWQELEDGLLSIKASRMHALKVAFFTWHNRVEAQHADHMMDELEDVFFAPGFDQSEFLQGASEVLEAIAVFWDGLESDRLNGIND